MKAYRYMEDNMGDTLTIKLFKLNVIKFTPCGYWVKTPYDNKGKHFINASSLKKYAHLNKEEALQSFIRRKESLISILENRLRIANEALIEGKKLINKEDK